jgi:hypothetical protein
LKKICDGEEEWIINWGVAKMREIAEEFKM